jgi:hypothetical protein
MKKASPAALAPGGGAPAHAYASASSRRAAAPRPTLRPDSPCSEQSSDDGCADAASGGLLAPPVDHGGSGYGAHSFQDLDISPPPPHDGTDADAAATAAAGRDPPGPFAVAVSDPTRVGDGMGAYMSYRVTTRTSLAHYAAGESCVQRRFRDFEWLYAQLVEKWPGLIVPPLPGKALGGKVSGSDFAPEFIEGRRRQLELFLRRVTAHAELHHAEALQTFLEAADDAFDASKATSAVAQPGRLGQLLTDGWQGLRSWSGKSLIGGRLGASVGIGGAASASGLPDGGGGDRQCDEFVEW